MDLHAFVLVSSNNPTACLWTNVLETCPQPILAGDCDAKARFCSVCFVSRPRYDIDWALLVVMIVAVRNNNEIGPARLATHAKSNTVPQDER